MKISVDFGILVEVEVKIGLVKLKPLFVVEALTNCVVVRIGGGIVKVEMFS